MTKYALENDPAPQPPGDDELLGPREVAALFKVDPKTVTRWAKSGKLPCFRTLGGHRRFRRGDVERAIEAAGS